MSYTHRRGVSVLVADDHAATRRFVATLLEDSGMWVVGEAGNGNEAVRECERLRPDVVVLDISMPLLNGFDAARQIVQFSPATKVIFLTGHTLKEYVIEANRVGALGFVSKKQAVHDLTKAIEAALEGKTYVSGDAAA